MLKRCLFACVLVACGGGAKKQTMVPETATSTGAIDSAPSECDKIAAHVADVVGKSPEAPKGATHDVLVELVASHCAKDEWSAEAKKCFGEISDPGGGEACAKTLTADQQTKLKDDANYKFGKRKAPSTEMDDDSADDAAEGKMGSKAPAPARAPAPTMKPPPAPPKAPPKGGASGGKGPVKSNDPCEGGE